MKKIMLFASALAGLFLAASCQRENLEPQQMAGTVKFTVEAPGAIATKTIADGQNVDVVHYAVYKTNSNETHAIEVLTERPLAQGFVPMSGKKANINFNLLQDQKYTVIFWAQVSQDDNGQNDYYELGDLRAISMKKDAENNIIGNEEARAAFFAWYSFETYEHKDHVVTLKRPFAQLNLLTTLESLTPKQTGETTGYTIDIEKSTVTVEGLTSTFYPYAQPVLEGTQGKAEETNETFTFTLEATPAVQGIGEGQDGDLLNVNGKAYHYVSMNYFFVPVDEYNVNLTYGIKTDKGSIENSVVSVPVKKNFRTNVIGNLLTKESKFEIIVDERFEGDNNLILWDGKEVKEPAYEDATKTYFITEPAELAWFAQAVNGGDKFSGKTVQLMNNIYLDNSMWTPIGAGDKKFEGTFDGQDNTIFDLNVTTEGTDPAGLFGRVQSGYVKNVKVVNARVQGHASAAVVVAHGVCAKIDNCHVENAVVVSTPYNKNEANNVGGIVGFLGADGGSAWAKDCTVTDADITAYRKVGGIVGSANQAAVVTGNKATDVNVTADHTYEYNEEKPIDLGEIAGYVHTQATVENNTTDDVDLIYKVDTVSEILSRVEGAHLNLAEGTYDLSDPIEVKASIEVTDGNVVLNATDITAGTAGDYAFITKGENASLVIDAKVASLGGGIAADNGAKIEFNGQGVDISKYTNSSPARYNIYASRGGEIVINSGTFKFNTTNNSRRAYVCVENGGKVIINGGTFGKASTRSGYTGIRVLDNQSEVIVYGGTFGFDPSEWVAPGYSAKKDGQNWVVVSVTGDNLSQLVATPGATVKVAAGEYKFPSSNIAEGVKIVCEPGTVFTGSSNLNIKTASVEGATFKNENGSIVNSGSISGTYKNCVFEGKNAFRYAYAGETVVFEDCTFRETADQWVFHFDGASTGVANPSIICRRCTFDGDRVAIAGAVKSLVMEDCDFINGSYFNSYCNSEYTGCNFNTSVRPLAAHHKYADCTIKGSALSISNLKLYEGYDCTLNIDGVAYTYADGLVKNAEGAVVAWHRGILADALAAADADMTIVLLNDIYGDVTVAQKEGVKIVIDGNGKNYDGMITVDGKSEAYATAGLTVKNLTFNASSITGDACIRLGDGTDATRYTSNVAVEGCTFEVPGAVGVKSYTGGDKNLKLSGCTATAAAHSLLQVAGVDEVLVEGCTINSKNGMNFNNSAKVTINECEADVKGYAARFGAGSAADTAVETYAITNSTLKSACEDGDAVIILRGTAANSTLTLTNTTLVGTTEITNNTNAQVIR